MKNIAANSLTVLEQMEKILSDKSAWTKQKVIALDAEDNEVFVETGKGVKFSLFGAKQKALFDLGPKWNFKHEENSYKFLAAAAFNVQKAKEKKLSWKLYKIWYFLTNGKKLQKLDGLYDFNLFASYKDIQNVLKEAKQLAVIYGIKECSKHCS